MGILYRFIKYNDKSLWQLEQLYMSAFPPDERRDFPVFISLLACGDVPFCVLGAFDDDNEDLLLAFISYWQFEKITYIEHFAVIKQMRGHGVGHMVFSHFIKNIASTVVLEVEPPTTLIASRRIRFYESLGMKLWDGFYYEQPPYAPDRNALELKLMTYGEVNLSMLKQVVTDIHKKVYGVSAE